MRLFSQFLTFLLLLEISIQGSKNRVEDLFEEYKGDIYSGYLNTLIEGNELFYIYTPSQTNPSKDPVLLWLNGGPGCSSLFGLLAEIGPVTTDNFSGVWKKNPYSWNLNANLLFIEQPAGVGFSITRDPKFPWTDDVTAKNLLAAVKDFFSVFSELKNRAFYVSGESYAGVYIPFLATAALEDTSMDKINFKGVLIGNGLTDLETDVERSMIEFGFWHGLISIETYNSFQKKCPHLPDEIRELKNFESIEGNKFNDSFNPRNVSFECNQIRRQIRNSFSGNDIYGIYRTCPLYRDFFSDEKINLRKKLTIKRTIFNSLRKKKKLGLEPEEDVWPSGCEDDLTVDKFLNIKSVKEKLKVNNISQEWTQCAGLDYTMTDSFTFYNETMKKFPEVQVWVFSGTEDGVLSTLGTMRWIQKLSFTIDTKWKQWKTNNQVSGYVQKYKEGLVIVTVKGAGHMVPQDRRAESKVLVDSFLNGVLPPN